MAFLLNETVPGSGNLPGNSTDLAAIRGNWTAMEDFFTNTKHYTFTSALSGYHIPGVVGMVGKSTTYPEIIDSKTKDGVVLINTAVGDVLVSKLVPGYLSSYNWYPIATSATYSFMRMTQYLPITTKFTKNTTSTVTFDTSQSTTRYQDGLSEFDAGTYRFDVTAEGYYFISLYGVIEDTTASVFRLRILVDGLEVARSVRTSHGSYTMCHVSDIVLLAAGDYVSFDIYHDADNDVTLYARTPTIVRLS